MKRCDGVVEHIEGEAVEDTDDDADEDFAVEVRWVAPVGDEGSFGDKVGLCPYRCGESELLGFVNVGFGRILHTLFLELGEFGKHGFVLV